MADVVRGVNGDCDLSAINLTLLGTLVEETCEGATDDGAALDTATNVGHGLITGDTFPLPQPCTILSTSPPLAS